MSEDVRTKLQASANGQNMRKRQSPKRKSSKKKEQAQKPEVSIKPIEYETQSIEEHQNVLFKPNAGPQTDFLAASEREVLYGGAAGGGKSIGLLADPMRYFSNANFNGLILRRTNDELRELIWKSQEMYVAAFPGAKWQEKKSQWVFPSGARLWMTYLEREDDVFLCQVRRVHERPLRIC